MSDKITKEGLDKLGFTKQEHSMRVNDGILFDIWRKKWLCIFESRESDCYQFRIFRDIDYILIKEVYFISEIENLYEAIKGEPCIDKVLPDIDERLSKVESLLKEMLDYSYSDQYAIADWVKHSKDKKDEMDRLAKESETYQNILKTLSNI